MSDQPVICFGQQPCGFLPKRFLYAKFVSARRIQAELGGRIVFFFHDSDHDPRETQTVLRNRSTGETQNLNFNFENKLQRKHSPLYLKRVMPSWQENTARQLPAYVEPSLAAIFRKIRPTNAADFCLDMYRDLGLLDGIEIVRSSDPTVRERACTVDDYYVDAPYEGEIVRARFADGKLRLHVGGTRFLDLSPEISFTKKDISPARDTRLRWMQSVIGCTHYVCGLGEQAYLRKNDAPEIVFLNREEIDRSDEAYVPPHLS